MSVTVMTDVDGHILHLDVNGARLDLDTQGYASGGGKDES